MNRYKRLAGLVAISVLTMTGCSQSAATTAPTAAAPAVASPSAVSSAAASTAAAPSAAAPASAVPASSATAAKPAPFNAGPVKIAMVRQSGAGDYFQQWEMGADAQAKAIGFQMQVYDAQADNALQATNMQTAMNSGVAGIIVDHGLTQTMDPLILQAEAKGIPVVVYDVDGTKPPTIHTDQSDADMATKDLTLMAQTIPDGAKIGYVNALGIAPLDRRNVVFQQFVKQHHWQVEFFVGKFTNDVATDNEVLVDAALKAHPDVQAIFAPYDELTKGTVSAVINNNLQSKIKVFGIDISNADIQVMTEPGSPWVATATTDPAGVRAAVVRTMALKLAGQLNTTEVMFPASLVTQQYLLQNNIHNMDQLVAKIPSLLELGSSTAPWITPAY
jgi:simple sugar transport system substrate-binding protein